VDPEDSFDDGLASGGDGLGRDEGDNLGLRLGGGTPGPLAPVSTLSTLTYIFLSFAKMCIY